LRISITSLPMLPESIGSSIGGAPLSKVIIALVGFVVMFDLYEAIG
jgi:hypothetical protein